MGLPMSTDSILGAAAQHLVGYDMSVSERNDVGEVMGKPTNILPNGSNISVVQSLPAADRRIRGGSSGSNQQRSPSASARTAPSSNRLAAPALAQLPRPENEANFTSRVVQVATANLSSDDPTQLRRTNRILEGLDGGSMRLVPNSFVSMADNGVPGQGQSQEAFRRISMLSRTPERPDAGDGS